MTIDEAIRHCEEVAEENEEIYEAHCRIYSKEVVEKYPSPPCKKCASEHRQLAEWLKELKAYREKLNCTDCIIDGTDACSRGAGRAVDDEICEDFIPSRSEIPNKSEIPTSCGDAISRQMAIDALKDIKDLQGRNLFAEKGLFPRNVIAQLPSVTPQQRTGRWKAFTHSAYHGNDEDGEPIWREVTVYHCNLCNRRTVIKEKYCPNCGAKMEVEE